MSVLGSINQLFGTAAVGTSLIRNAIGQQHAASAQNLGSAVSGAKTAVGAASEVNKAAAGVADNPAFDGEIQKTQDLIKTAETPPTDTSILGMARQTRQNREITRGLTSATGSLETQTVGMQRAIEKGLARIEQQRKFEEFKKIVMGVK